MSDITRDDLRAWPKPRTNHRPVTDEEFDRLAREQGYVKPFHRVEVPLDLSTLDATDRAKALRALLTDECDVCHGRGTLPPTKDEQRYGASGDDFHTCPACGGRGWLPKDGVEVTESYVEGYLGGSGLMLDYLPDEPGKRFYVVPSAWLEAEGE